MGATWVIFILSTSEPLETSKELSLSLGSINFDRCSRVLLYGYKMVNIQFLNLRTLGNIKRNQFVLCKHHFLKSPGLCCFMGVIWLIFIFSTLERWTHQTKYV